MVDLHFREQKLASIAERLARISSKLPPTRQAFLDDRDAQEAVAFNLFLAFQDAIDLAAHLIADKAGPLPMTPASTSTSSGDWALSRSELPARWPGAQGCGTSSPTPMGRSILDGSSMSSRRASPP